MLFDAEKCHVLQVGAKNKKFDYEMCGIKLKSVQCAKDLSVKIASNLKFSQHCNDVANKANRVLAPSSETLHLRIKTQYFHYSKA